MQPPRLPTNTLGAPDFRALLAEQCAQVESSVATLERALSAEDGEMRAALEQEERAADDLRRRNMRELDAAFSTPYDPEDIYRAIGEMDWIVVHVMRTGRELHVLATEADDVVWGLVGEIGRGVGALRRAWDALDEDSEAATHAVEEARDTDRRARKRYEEGLAALFERDDPREILKYREIYHHLVDGAHRVRKAALVLRSIQVNGS